MTLAKIGALALLCGSLVWLVALLFARYRRTSRIAAIVGGWAVGLGFALAVVATVYR